MQTGLCEGWILQQAVEIKSLLGFDSVSVSKCFEGQLDDEDEGHRDPLKYQKLLIQ
jgi:hypothetical protein